MEFSFLSNKYLLRFDKGEEFQETMKLFAEKNEIKSAHFYGLGALTNVELGWFDITSKKYCHKKFEDYYEVVNITGNLSQREDEIFVHSHVMLSGSNFHVFGGHLFSGIISVTAEIFLFPLKDPIIREYDQASGFAPIKIS